jgi:hypothetical protein
MSASEPNVQFIQDKWLIHDLQEEQIKVQKQKEAKQKALQAV